MSLKKLCFKVRPGFYFSFFEEKNTFAKINPILKYVALWHSDIDIDGHYHFLQLRLCHFAPY